MADKGGGRAIQLKPLSIISGLLFGLGLAVLLQQYGVRPMTTGWLILWIVIGLVIGIAIPTIGHAVGKKRAAKGGS